MLVPKLAVNPTHLFPDDFYQITNISEDGKYYDFLGFKHLSLDNTWAANIVRDRTDPNYYDNLDYGLTSDDLDKTDMQCIAEGIEDTDMQVSACTRPEQKPLRWEEFDETKKENDDMTKEEIDKYVLETYHVSFDDVEKDKEILKRHEFIITQYEKMKAAEKEVGEANEVTERDECKLEAEPESKEAEEIKDKVVTQEITKQNADTIINTKNFLIDHFGEYIEENCSSFNRFCQALLGDAFTDSAKESMKLLAKDTMHELNMPPIEKKLYDGVLARMVDKGNALGIFKKRYTNKMILEALKAAK